MEFSQQIREATTAHHRAAEAGPFISRFLRRQIERHEYEAMHAKLYPVYLRMEAQLLRHRDHPLVQPFILPQLWRAPSLEEDLAYLLGANWQDQIAPSPATTAYVDRIQWVGDHEPEILLGHIYTRYLGDLSGGQALARIVRGALSLEGEQGTRFYVFDAIDDAKAFKNDFRRRMDDLPLEGDQGAKIIEESKHVFDLNGALFNEIA